MGTQQVYTLLNLLFIYVHNFFNSQYIPFTCSCKSQKFKSLLLQYPGMKTVKLEGLEQKHLCIETSSRTSPKSDLLPEVSHACAGFNWDSFGNSLTTMKMQYHIDGNISQLVQSFLCSLFRYEWMDKLPWCKLHDCLANWNTESWHLLGLDIDGPDKVLHKHT